MDIKYRHGSLALLTDLRSPYLGLGVHPEWYSQFVKTINSTKVHARLEEKLAPFGNMIICYTKITPDKRELLSLCGFDKATICVISSVGEHAMTPWMIIHNIGHTLISNNIWIKNDIREILGLTSPNYSIFNQQQHLVKCAAARKMMIPNLNEVIYELFTTWVWYGKTRSGDKELRDYCDVVFPEIIRKYKNQMVWHKYRPPMHPTPSSPWLKEFIESLGTVKPKSVSEPIG
jgi:hypothetical protein